LYLTKNWKGGEKEMKKEATIVLILVVVSILATVQPTSAVDTATCAVFGARSPGGTIQILFTITIPLSKKDTIVAALSRRPTISHIACSP
jgi:hypothetical protein